MPDLVADLGHLFLGSRLKRVAERLQADAAKVHRAMGVDAQPAEVALLAALDRFGPMTVSATVEALGVSQPAVTRTAAGLVERGLVASEPGEDQRQKLLTLTRQGRALIAKAKKAAWPIIDEAVTALCAPLAGTLLEQLALLEQGLEERPLEARALAAADRARDVVTIRDYDDELATAFHDINAEWIESMFVLEKKDVEILSNPRGTIIDSGGVVLFAESKELGVIGTAALMKVEDGVYELTKMGVTERARGRKAGELLLSAAIARAKAMRVKTLYLLTNRKCVAAIRLYEKLGFIHDNEINRRYGATYTRCDVAMRYPL
ncbi:MAG: bifunctional helix-turn-helix transcriptional regulator/GNAT family N-acetyltransferase [Labilithrix sp.]|nr:bifunctional helix-turn-helix transcriptional regulator/GNAT family N-acetyltransferase [Labilithrix sp.]MCW5811494.1 bifunctional helix-turn-helix transcriptional regulator/GNAT family N-acetyltransferase [Labilithrix sp.]